MNDIQKKDSLESIGSYDLISSFVLQTFPKDASDKIDVSTKFADLIIDSLSYIEFVVAVEEKFNIEFDDDVLALDTFNTIGDLISYVQKKVENGQ